MTSSPGLWRLKLPAAPLWSVTDDDDRRLQPLLIIIIIKQHLYSAMKSEDIEVLERYSGAV